MRPASDLDDRKPLVHFVEGRHRISLQMPTVLLQGLQRSFAAPIPREVVERTAVLAPVHGQRQLGVGVPSEDQQRTGQEPAKSLRCWTESHSSREPSIRPHALKLHFPTQVIHPPSSFVR